MPTNEELWDEAIYLYRETPNEEHAIRYIYRLCQSFGALILNRRYGSQVSLHDLDDSLANASFALLERARQEYELRHPRSYFFFACSRYVRELSRGVAKPSNERERWQERATAHVGVLQDAERSVDTTCLLVENIGDLLRAGGAMRREQRLSYARLPFEHMRSCCERLYKQARELADSAILQVNNVDRVIAESIFCARDRLESARVGFSYWSMEHDFSLAYGIELLDREFARMDDKLSELEAPFAAQRLLNTRQALVSPLTPPRYASDEEQQNMPIPSNMEEVFDEMLADFLCEGDYEPVLLKVIEGSEDTKLAMKELLEATHLTDLPRSLAARRLARSFEMQEEQAALQEEDLEQKTLKGVPQTMYHPTPSALPIVLPRLQQSATVNAPLISEEKLKTVELGKLPNHDAHLSIVAEVESPVLVVEQGNETLIGVSFGGQTHPRRGHNTWEIPLGRWPKPNEPIRATFQFRDGPPITEEFCFPDMPEMPQVTKRHGA